MMTNETLVSVIIATFNMGQYLADAIRSVLGQTWRNLEIIVIDDGSTDDTFKVMLQFEKNNKVKYIRTDNQGQPKAKNRGIRESKGRFIAFCDADDLWESKKLEQQMPLFSDPVVGVVYSEVSYIDKDGQEIQNDIPYKRYSGLITSHLLLKNFIPFGTAVIKRECILHSGIFDENIPMGIDWDLWLRYSVDWEFRYLPEKTYAYRLWHGQMSRNYRGRYRNAFLILNKFIENYPNSISQKDKARAWADMYVSRAMSLAKSEGIVREPIVDIFLGLRHDWSYYLAWKSLIKILVGRL